MNIAPNVMPSVSKVGRGETSQRPKGEVMVDVSIAKLNELTLERAKHEYAELCDNWKQIDAKSHQTASIAGFFLAAAFAFSNSNSTPLDTHLKVGLVALLTTLICTIIFAIISMRVREATMPIAAERVCQDVDLLAKGSETPNDDYSKRYNLLLRQHIDHYIKTNDELGHCNASKVSWLQRAQTMLVTSAIVSAALTIARMLSNE